MNPEHLPKFTDKEKRGLAKCEKMTRGNSTGFFIHDFMIDKLALNGVSLTVFALIYSLSAGVISTLVMWLFSKTKIFGAVGFSILGALTHNLVQTVVALILLGTGVLYYAPFLIFSAIISGGFIGFLAKILDKKIKTFF